MSKTHFVGAFPTKDDFILDQKKVYDTLNKMTIIAKLLDSLHLKNQIIIINATG
jgi:hypothetical protein